MTDEYVAVLQAGGAMDNFSSLFGDDSLGLDGLESFGSQPQATPVPVTEEAASAFQPSPTVSQVGGTHSTAGPTICSGHDISLNREILTRQ